MPACRCSGSGYNVRDFAMSVVMLTRGLMRSCIGLALLSAVLAALAFGAPAGEWQEMETTEQELHDRFGGRENEISLSQATSLLIALVNRDRQEAGLSSVARDRVATVAAREHALEMASHRYLSHLDLAGHKPSRRYNAAGGTDQVSENLSYWESDVRIYLTPQLVRDIQKRWMNSEEHRANILSPTHTGVGVAIVLLWDGKRSVLTAAQEFVDDCGDYSRLPAKAGINDELTLEGELTGELQLIFVGVGYEPLPEPQQPDTLNEELNGYSLPRAFVGILPAGERFRRSFTDMPTLYLLRDEPARGRFRLKLTLAELFAALEATRFPTAQLGEFKPGLYYFMVYARSEESRQFVVSAQVVEVRS